MLVATGVSLLPGPLSWRKYMCVLTWVFTCTGSRFNQARTNSKVSYWITRSSPLAHGSLWPLPLAPAVTNLALTICHPSIHCSIYNFFKKIKAIGKCCNLLQHPDQRYRLVTEQTSEGQDVACHDAFRAQTFCWCLAPFQGPSWEQGQNVLSKQVPLGKNENDLSTPGGILDDEARGGS